MKITDYYPIFYTEDIESEIKRFTEEMGFSLRHRPKLESLEYAVLENDNKSRIDLVCSHFPADSFSEGFLGMRANVDDYKEGVTYFEAQGYSVFGTVHESESSVYALMTKGDGDYLVIFQHKR